MGAHPEAKFGMGFCFKDWDFCVDSGTLELRYSNPEFGDFTESYQFPKPDPKRLKKVKKPLQAAFDCLHWMAGVSYYKTTLSPKLSFTGRTPSELQAQWLTQTWQAGLAELAFENGLPWLDHIQFTGQQASVLVAQTSHLAPRSLVAIGGGKDSLVSIEAIKSMGEEASLFMVGQSEFIQGVAHETGLPLLQIKRQVDGKLSQANAAGAFNGHVPITAINACVAVAAALIFDFDSVVFSNERSAEVGNFKAESGQWVNHQHSKSLAYELLWQQVIEEQIAKDLDCFSLLRPFSELAIVKKFSHLERYFPHFSSCNRNFHLAGSQNEAHHWCGHCPKCAFVFLCLAPFVSKDKLLGIFRKNLLADDQLDELFESLLGIQGVKPFECVGEEQECRLALQLLSAHPDWQNNPKVKSWLTQMPVIEAAEAVTIMTASKGHGLPEKRNFKQVLTDVT